MDFISTLSIQYAAIYWSACIGIGTLSYLISRKVAKCLS